VLGELFLFALVGLFVVVALAFGLAYILAMSGVVSLENRIFAPVNWLVDVVYRFDGWLEKITFGHKSNDA